MLLSANEVIVTPGGFRLFDFVSPWLELRSIERPPSLDSTIFVLITLGHAGSTQVIQADTNGFTLSQIPGYKNLHRQWRELSGKGRFEQSFFEFLLSHFRGDPEVRLEFPVDDGRLKRFIVHLGRHISLLGRFPEDIDTLSMCFEPVEVLQD